MRRASFSLDKVEIKLKNEKRARWKWGKRDVAGWQYGYDVKDLNRSNYRRWTFQVQVPDRFTKGAYIIVQPTSHPQLRVLAGIDRRSISFGRATRGNYLAKAYAKVMLGDIYDDKNKRGVRLEQKHDLPQWIQAFSLRAKQTVTTTRGADGNALVAVMEQGNYEQMIRLFLATRVWVLYTGFGLE